MNSWGYTLCPVTFPSHTSIPFRHFLLNLVVKGKVQETGQRVPGLEALGSQISQYCWAPMFASNSLHLYVFWSLDEHGCQQKVRFIRIS